jgi:hypothetical protein
MKNNIEVFKTGVFRDGDESASQLNLFVTDKLIENSICILPIAGDDFEINFVYEMNTKHAQRLAHKLLESTLKSDEAKALLKALDDAINS